MKTILRALLEYHKCTETCPQSLYVSPSLEDPLLWEGVIFLAHGFWEGAVYRFTISIPETYPSDFPVVTFTQPVYNPYIDPETNILDLKLLSGKADTIHMSDILFFIKDIFCKWELLTAHQNEDFQKLVRENVALSQEPANRLSSPFSKFQECHKDTLNKILRKSDFTEEGSLV